MNANRKVIAAEGVWKLERYGKFEENDMSEMSSKTGGLYLIFKSMQLMVICDGVMVETIPVLESKVDMIFKDGNIGIRISNGENRVRKSRGSFAGVGLVTPAMVGKYCMKMLKKYVNIIDQNNIQEPVSNQSEVPLHQQVAELLASDPMSFYADNSYLSQTYPLSDIVDACIMDVQFPSFVAEVHKILNEKISLKPAHK